MARKHYSVDEVLRALSHKNDLRIQDYTIYILSDYIWTNAKGKILNPHKKFDIGNKSWGKIDFLTNIHDYRVSYVDEF